MNFTEKVREIVNQAENCPNCENVGWYARPDRHIGEPEQIQCEFCYTNPKSKFNVLQLILSLIESDLLPSVEECRCKPSSKEELK